VLDRSFLRERGKSIVVGASTFTQQATDSGLDREIVHSASIERRARPSSRRQEVFVTSA